VPQVLTLPTPLDVGPPRTVTTGTNERP